MKKVININFQGRVVPIEETAYDILKQYVESLRRFFDNEEGKDEIINDIEGRIAELFAETLKKGSTCITDDDVNAIIKSMGRPEEFEAEEASVKSQLSGEGKKQQQSYSGGSSAQGESTTGQRPSRLFRDENNKLLGGVCAGIANYFGVDKIIVRILFVLGFGITFIPYLILWVAVPSTASAVIGSMRKRLFRDPDNKWIAGVCGGLSSYFGVNVWIPRLLFLIPFLSFVTSWNHWGVFNFPNFLNLSFSPGATIIYIILWLILPEAVTTSDKLEMKGEKVDMNSIKNTIQKDMEGFGERAKEFGKEVGEKAVELGTKIGERSKTVGSEAGTIVRRTGTTLGDVISMIFKIFAYFILAVVLFALVAALFFSGIALTSLLSFKDYLITEGWQSLFVWGTLILFIWVPIIGIITFIIRRLAKVKSNSSFIRFTFIALWLVGLFCVMGLIVSLSNDFQYHNTPVETQVKLSNPSVSKLELKDAPDTRYYVNNSWLHLEPFASIDQDTVRVKNIRLRIMKSETDSFQVSLLKMASGANRAEAEERVEKMEYNVTQKDSLLEFERGFAITPKEKFRNQIIYVTIHVPVGKRILIDRNTYWNDYVHIGIGWEMNDWDWQNEGNNGFSWDSDVEYIMTESGLKPTHPVKEENTDEDNNNNGDNKDNKKDINKDTLKNGNDSSRYHYQPAKKEEPAKGEIKAALSPSIEKHFLNIDIHDLASTLLGRVTI